MQPLLSKEPKRPNSTVTGRPPAPLLSPAWAAGAGQRASFCTPSRVAPCTAALYGAPSLRNTVQCQPLLQLRPLLATAATTPDCLGRPLLRCPHLRCLVADGASCVFPPFFVGIIVAGENKEREMPDRDDQVGWTSYAWVVLAPASRKNASQDYTHTDTHTHTHTHTRACARTTVSQMHAGAAASTCIGRALWHQQGGRAWVTHNRPGATADGDG